MWSDPSSPSHRHGSQAEQFDLEKSEEKWMSVRKSAKGNLGTRVLFRMTPHRTWLFHLWWVFRRKKNLLNWRLLKCLQLSLPNTLWKTLHYRPNPKSLAWSFILAQYLSKLLFLQTMSNQQHWTVGKKKTRNAGQKFVDVCGERGFVFSTKNKCSLLSKIWLRTKEASRGNN